MSDHDSLAAALVAALADLKVVELGDTADMGSFKVRYASLPDVVKKTRPALAAHGVVALTPLCSLDGQPAVSVVLIHESGDRMDFGPFPFQHGRDAQATGSWVTYMRRYALVAALGMAAGDDDDGASAQPVPARMSKDAAKAVVLELAGDDAELAKAAWKAIWETPWLKDDLTAAYEQWANQDPVEVTT